jgi:hypothetical protein
MKIIGRKFAEVLLVHHRNCCSTLNTTADQIDDWTDRRSCIKYGDLVERAGVRTQPRNCGPFLDDVARWCQVKGWPPLASLVVAAKTGQPGIGYEEAPNGGLARWPDEVRRCIAFRGYSAKFL